MADEEEKDGGERSGQSEEARGLPTWLEPIDHTGDAGFVVSADGLRRLFARAAWALFSVITDPDQIEVQEWSSVSVEADDLQALMVKWLSELNFLHITEHTLLGAFEIETLEETRLKARVGGEPIDMERHIVYTEVKAVTYHQLEVVREGDKWKARVILDL